MNPAAAPVAAPPSSPGGVSEFGKWMALIAALLGWLFDGLEMGLFPLVQRPALMELLETTDATRIVHWQGIITAFFLIGAATGGVLFGWLGDRIGRVRSMMLSVLTYALVSAACGFADSAAAVGILRFIAALGMGGEWSLGVALITELWPNRSRAFLAGLIGAAANVGYLIIAIVGLSLLKNIGQTRDFLSGVLMLPEGWTQRLLSHDGWRFLMMLGAVPALLTFFIRIFVPESERWEREKQSGGTSHWATEDLLAVLLGAGIACGVIALWMDLKTLPSEVKIAGTVVGLALVTICYLYPVYQYLGRSAGTSGHSLAERPPILRRMLLAACLSAVALLGTWGSVQQAPAWSQQVEADRLREAYPDAATRPAMAPVNSYTQIASSTGAVVGSLLAALLGGWLGRRVTYCLLCLASMAIIPTFFHTSAEPVSWTFWSLAFGMGAITASFYGWLPLYLPELFRTAVRATGQGFGFNFGRVIAAIAVLQLGPLKELLTGKFSIAGRNIHLHGGFPEVATALSSVYLIGLVLIWFAPETKDKPLPE